MINLDVRRILDDFDEVLKPARAPAALLHRLAEQLWNFFAYRTSVNLSARLIGGKLRF